ncbi:MAG TPA: hypothetical protein PLJ23_09945 [Gemmatimonadales bacterium]|nr:hypothetical protein [Gemmatimonadales bacterium]
MSVGSGNVSPSALFGARVAELLAMLDQPGLVGVVDVETAPAGGTRYDLRVPAESSTVGSRPTLGEVVQAMTRVADAVIQGRSVGMTLRGDAAPGAARSEVAVLGGMLRTLVARTEQPAPPVLQGIVRRAVEPGAPDRYASVIEFRGDLLKLQQVLPVAARGGTLELTPTARVLAAMEFPGVITVTSAVPLADGRVTYGLRQLLDGDMPLPGGMASTADVVSIMARLSDAVVQGRDLGMLLRELSSRGMTLTFAGADGRAELTALGTVFRDLLGTTTASLPPTLTATLQRALDPESPEAFEDVSELRDELARQQQAARLVPVPTPRLDVRETAGQRGWWFVAVFVLLALGVLLFR